MHDRMNITWRAINFLQKRCNFTKLTTQEENDMKIQRGIINKTIIAICTLALSFCTGTHAEELGLTNSNGRITINTNDGAVTIDTDDIEANAQAIAELQGQLGNLSFKYGTEAAVSGDSSKDDVKGYYWSKDSTGNWVKIGAVGSAVPSDVLTGKKFSSEAGVDIDGIMPNPTQGTMNDYVAPTSGSNVNQGTVDSGNAVTITNSDDTTVITNDTEIDLGIGQSVTIPKGYYNGDIVVKNNVANRGASGIVLDSSTRSVSLPAGYYSGVSCTTSLNPAGSVTYRIGHHHTGTGGLTYPNGCYTSAYSSYEQTGTRQVKCGHWNFVSGHGASQSGCYNTFRCTGCGAEERIWCVADSDGSGWGAGDHMKTEPVYSYVTRYALGCGKNEGDFIRDSRTSYCSSNEKILSATITY